MIKYTRWILLLLLICMSKGFSAEVPITFFPIKDYNQHVSHWINKKNFPNYKNNLLNNAVQKNYFENFKQHWLSAWNPARIKKILGKRHPSIGTLERAILRDFDNAEKTPKHKNYDINFRPHDEAWINALKNSINLEVLKKLNYTPKRRAILLSNTEGRILPTNDVSFYQFTLPGEGYPFDNLQMTSLWAGTPIYVLAKTNDQAWSLIVSPDVIAWVPSNTIARVTQQFVNRWRKATKQRLAAIIHTKTPFIRKRHFYFHAYVGSVYPESDDKKLLFPVLTQQGVAMIASAPIPSQNFVRMPFSASPQHFALVLKALIGRPYGWGGLYFYNDCSQELRSLYTPFGIWLPRHSSDQVHVGETTDQKSASTSKRIQYLKESGHPLMSLVYIKGHVFLYIGNVADHKEVLTYQNIWGLHPADNSRRAVIGKAVFLPLLNQYKENTQLASLASREDFQVSDIAKFKPMPEIVDVSTLIGYS